MPALDEGHSQLRRKELELLQDDQGDRHRSPGKALIEQLGARREAEASLLDDLDVVVGKADGSEGKRGKDNDPDKGIGGVGPEHCRQQNRDGDQHAAHRRSAGLLQVRLRAVIADILADLKFAQLLYHPGANEQRDEQRRAPRRRRCER